MELQNKVNDFTLTESIKSVYAIDLYIAVQESVFKFQIKNKILMERTVCVCVHGEQQRKIALI